MANWYYYNASGEKVGPVRRRDLTALVKDGTVTPDTIIESEDGRQVPASQVQGLTFVPATAVPAPAQFWYYDAAGQKIGPVGSRDLAALAKNGGILPDTIVETARGQQGKARQLKGLEFAPSPFAPTNPFSNPVTFPIPVEQSPFAQPAPMTATPMSSFCTYCGQPVHPAAAVCMTCGTNPRKHRKFCGSCGVPINEVQIICTKCHTPIGGKGLLVDSAPKQRLTYFLLAVILLGGYGIHNFYAERKIQAITQLIIGLLGTVLTVGVVTVGVWIWAIVEAFTVKEDGEGQPMV